MNLKGLVLADNEGSRFKPFAFSRSRYLIPLLDESTIQFPIMDLVETGIKYIEVVVYFRDAIMCVLGDKQNRTSNANS
jgi:dTDP-glucose pyrophosphorylase